MQATAQATAARRCALAVLRRVLEQGAYADRALHAEAQRAGLDGRDRALATALAYAAVQRRLTLDHLIERLAGRPVARLDAPVASVLRLGLVQLLLLDGIPAHAAVAESVELAKAEAPRAAGLVNAVLRRASREGRALLDALPDDTPAAAALRHSHPAWLAELWWGWLGPEEARALMARDNEPAEAALRANTLRTSADELAARLGVPTHPAPGLPEGLVLEAPFDAHGSDLWAAGLYMPQSRASMSVARLLDPRPGERVLDLCAAPGGKTTHLAALMEGRGDVVAVERHPGRAAALERTCARMGTENVRVRVGDAAGEHGPEGFDRVLADPPCSGLGTLSSRPDLRWRASPEGIAELATEQARIADAAARALRPGGVLVYSVCTLSPRESGEQVAQLRERRPDLVLEEERLLLPHRDGTDGFYLARLRREESGTGVTNGPR